MNDTLGFQEVRSSILRSPSSRFPHEQRHQCGTDFRFFLSAHNLLGFRTSINTEPKSFLTSFLQLQEQLMSCAETREETIHSNPGNVIHELRIEERLG